LRAPLLAPSTGIVAASFAVAGQVVHEQPIARQDDGALRFDIHLQGEGETVFLDFDV